MPHKEEDRSDQGLQLKYKEVKLVYLGGGRKLCRLKASVHNPSNKGTKTDFKNTVTLFCDCF